MMMTKYMIAIGTLFLVACSADTSNLTAEEACFYQTAPAAFPDGSIRCLDVEGQEGIIAGCKAACRHGEGSLLPAYNQAVPCTEGLAICVPVEQQSASQSGRLPADAVQNDWPDWVQ